MKEDAQGAGVTPARSRQAAPHQQRLWPQIRESRERVKMTRLRQTIARRLKELKTPPC
jgi:pyruvate/2-oxoglutarate dehydrogenase complex dihydrolipoamide acyltransferase (E2) component